MFMAWEYGRLRVAMVSFFSQRGNSNRPTIRFHVSGLVHEPVLSRQLHRVHTCFAPVHHASGHAVECGDLQEQLRVDPSAYSTSGIPAWLVQPHRSGRRGLVGPGHAFGQQECRAAVLCATLLTRKAIRLRRVPDITDVRKILAVFEQIGSEVHADWETGVVDIHHQRTLFDVSQHRLPQEMRSSIMLVPPLLARFGFRAHRERRQRMHAGRA